jgi:hypothetical protein
MRIQNARLTPASAEEVIWTENVLFDASATCTTDHEGAQHVESRRRIEASSTAMKAPTYLTTPARLVQKPAKQRAASARNARKAYASTSSAEPQLEKLQVAQNTVDQMLECCSVLKKSLDDAALAAMHATAKSEPRMVAMETELARAQDTIREVREELTASSAHTRELQDCVAKQDRVIELLTSELE